MNIMEVVGCCCPICNSSNSSWRVYNCYGFFSVLAGIVLTNDGNAILRELDVAHPAAKV
jgi:hypothetical protein